MNENIFKENCVIGIAIQVFVLFFMLVLSLKTIPSVVSKTNGNDHYTITHTPPYCWQALRIRFKSTSRGWTSNFPIFVLFYAFVSTYKDLFMNCFSFKSIGRQIKLNWFSFKSGARVFLFFLFQDYHCVRDFCYIYFLINITRCSVNIENRYTTRWRTSLHKYLFRPIYNYTYKKAKLHF